MKWHLNRKKIINLPGHARCAARRRSGGRSHGHRERSSSSRVYSIHARIIDRTRVAGISKRIPGFRYWEEYLYSVAAKIMREKFLLDATCNPSDFLQFAYMRAPLCVRVCARAHAFQAEWEIERSKLLLDRIIDYRFLLKLDSNDDLRFNLCSTRCNVMYPNLLFVGHTLSKRKIIFTCSV